MIFTQSRRDERYSLSRNRCLESSMALLQMQDMLYQESKAKGHIREPRWYSVEFLSLDFILGECYSARYKCFLILSLFMITWSFYA